MDDWEAAAAAKCNMASVDDEVVVDEEPLDDKTRDEGVKSPNGEEW